VRGVALGTWHTVEHNTLTVKAARSQRVSSAPRRMGKGATGTARCGITRCEDSTPLPAWVLTGRLRPSGLRQKPRRCVPRSGLSRQTLSSSPPPQRMVGELTEERVANAMRKALPVSQTPLSSSAGGVWGVEAMWERVWRPSSCERARPRLC